MLATALQIAARKVTSPAPGANNDRRMVWGVQVDAALATDAENGRRLTAAYLAKYATKGSDEHGVLDHGHPSTNFAQDEVESQSSSVGSAVTLKTCLDLVRPLGFEPRTFGLRVRCSAIELEARATTIYDSSTGRTGAGPISRETAG